MTTFSPITQNRYEVLTQQSFTDGAYQLVPFRELDLMPVMHWRNAQLEVLRQAQPLTETQQQQYYQTAIQTSFTAQTPDMILFSFLKNDACIGYGGLTRINWPAKRAEVSFLLTPERTQDIPNYQADFAAFLTILKTAAFNDLQLNRLFTETYDMRPHHVAVLESCGFQLEGRLRRHLSINNQLVDVLFHGCLKEDGR